MDTTSQDAIETTKEVSQHFAEITQTDPLAAICFVLGLIAISLIIISFLSARLKSKVPSLASMGGRFVLLMCGGFFLMLPIAMHLPSDTGEGLMWPFLYQSIPAAFFMMFNTLGFSANLVLWTPVIHSVMGYSVLANLYFWLIVFYIVASPIMLALTAADVIVNGLTGIVITVQSWVQALFKRPVYVFCGVDENTLTLAKNLLEHLKQSKSRSKPLMIFSNVDGSEDAREKLLIQEVRELSYGVASLVSTPLSATSIPAHLAHLVHIRSVTSYFVISEDSQKNVRLAQTLLNDAIAKLERYEQRAKRAHAHPKVGYAKKTLRYAAHTKLWCLDSAEHDFSLDYDERRKHLYNLVEVNVLNTERDVIWDCFLQHPATSLLRPINVTSGKKVPVQELTIIVANCDTAGLQALRVASWFARLPGVKLELVGASTDPQQSLLSLAVTAPGMLQKDDVIMLKCDVSNEDLYSFCEGKEVEAYCYHNGAVEPIKRKISTGANVYTLLVNESQEGSLPCALHVMRALEKRVFSLKEAKHTVRKELPKTLIMLETNMGAQDVLLEPKDKTESAKLVQMKTFGSKKEQFSYKKIIEGEKVKGALSVKKHMNQQVRRDGLEVGAQIEPLSTQKLALVSAMYYVPSLLWCMGYPAKARSAELPTTTDVRKLLFGDATIHKDLLETITFENRELSTHGALARETQLKAHEKELVKTAPILVKLANIERERMQAYLRAHGWTPTSDNLQELLDINQFFGIGGTAHNNFPNPSIAQTKEDFLLVDDLAQYYMRSAACGCDSPAYDRTRVVYSLEAYLS